MTLDAAAGKDPILELVRLQVHAVLNTLAGAPDAVVVTPVYLNNKKKASSTVVGGPALRSQGEGKVMFAVIEALGRASSGMTNHMVERLDQVQESRKAPEAPGEGDATQ